MSTLFKPVYVTSTTPASKKISIHQRSINDYMSSSSPPSTSFSFIMGDQMNAINQDLCKSAPSYTQLSTSLPSLLPKYISTKVIKLRSSKDIQTGYDDECQSLFIARPYRRLISLCHPESSPNIARVRSSSIGECFETESVKTLATLETNFPENPLTDNTDNCTSSSALIESPDKYMSLHQSPDGNQCTRRVFKSLNDYYLTVPPFNEKVESQEDTALKTVSSLPSDHSSIFHSNAKQSISFLRPTPGEPFSSDIADPITLVSPTQSPDCMLSIKSCRNGLAPYRQISGSSLESYTLSEAANVTIISEHSALHHTKDITVVNSYLARQTAIHNYKGSLPSSYEKFYFKHCGAHGWLPVIQRDFSDRKCVCSVIYTPQSMAGILPVKFVDYQTIYDIQAEFAAAKASIYDPGTPNLTLVVKFVTVLRALPLFSKGAHKCDPIYTESLVSIVDSIADDICVRDHQNLLLQYETGNLFEISKNYITSVKEHISCICSVGEWASELSRCISPEPSSIKSFLDYNKEKEKTLPEKYANERNTSEFLESDSKLKNSRKGLPSIADDNLVESNQLPYFPNRNLTLEKNQLEFISRNCAKDEIAKEGLYSLTRSGPSERVIKTVTPPIDIKIVPKIPTQDEPTKLNVIKGTTSYKQLVEYIAKRTVKETSRNLDMGRSKRSTTSVNKQMLTQLECTASLDDNESFDSSTLIPEGHAGGWNAGDEGSDIYLSWSSIVKPQKVKVCRVY